MILELIVISSFVILIYYTGYAYGYTNGYSKRIEDERNKE